MPTGSSGQEPRYSSFDPNVLADGRRSNELPVKSQYAGDNKKLKDAARDPKSDKQSENKNSTGEKSASLIFKYTLGIGHANAHRLSVQCCSRAPPKESRLAPVLLFRQPEQSFESCLDMKPYLSFTLWHSSLVGWCLCLTQVRAFFFTASEIVQSRKITTGIPWLSILTILNPSSLNHSLEIAYRARPVAPEPSACQAEFQAT